MKKNIIDRVSELPEFIVHHILSFLDSPVELVRTSVLSKKWFALTASFPILDFHVYNFCRKSLKKSFKAYKNGYKEDKFIKYVAYTISRFCKQNLSVHTFKLSTGLQDPIEVDIINRWVGLISEKGVQVMVIDIEPLLVYRLPNTLLSASSLTSLKICFCELPSSLLVDAVKFKYLKMLHLYAVPLTEELIKCLTSCCPVLEEFNVENCYGFKTFCVFGHQNLQKVWIRYDYDHEIERFDIESPNLEDLTLDLPDYCNYLNLSSHSVRTLVLKSATDLEEIYMNTPNLVSFVYTAYSHVPSFPLKSGMECHRSDYVGNLWFQWLRRFLEKNNGFKELKLHISVDMEEVEELKMIQWLPIELEHVDLKPKYLRYLPEYESAVDAVLWCCRPRSLTLESSYFCYFDFEEWTHLVKFTYEKLLQQEENQGHTNIRIILSSKSEIHFSNLSSLFKSVPHDVTKHKITFIKEQVV